jgi:hypothetical protein
MASYTYVSNVSPSDGFDRIDIPLDNGQKTTIRRGSSYDLSATEVARARRYVVMAPTSSGAAPDVVSYLPIRGTISDGQVPVWSASAGAFVPGDVAGAGAGTTAVIVENISSGWPTRPTGVPSVTWIGWTDPTALMQEYDIFVAVPTPLP